MRIRINLTSQVKDSGEVAVNLWARVKKEHREPGESLGPEWMIQGQVRRVLKLNRKLLYVGEHSELAQPLPVQTIPIEVLVPLQSLSAQCDLAGFTAKIERLNRGEAILQLRSAPRSVGPFEGTVSLQPVLKGGQQLPVQRLLFEGKIVSDIEAVPPEFLVGGRVLGDAIEEVVMLRSLTGRQLVDVRSEAQGEGLAVEVLKGGNGLRIRQKITAAGSCTNRVRVYAKAGDRQVETVLPVTYTGVEPN